MLLLLPISHFHSAAGGGMSWETLSCTSSSGDAKTKPRGGKKKRKKKTRRRKLSEPRLPTFASSSLPAGKDKGGETQSLSWCAYHYAAEKRRKASYYYSRIGQTKVQERGGKQKRAKIITDTRRTFWTGNAEEIGF